MHPHRFADQMFASVAEDALTPDPQGFVACPLALLHGQGQGCPWQHVYQLALAQARAVVRPTWLARYQNNIQN